MRTTAVAGEYSGLRTAARLGSESVRLTRGHFISARSRSILPTISVSTCWDGSCSSRMTAVGRFAKICPARFTRMCMRWRSSREATRRQIRPERATPMANPSRLSHNASSWAPMAAFIRASMRGGTWEFLNQLPAGPILPHRCGSKHALPDRRRPPGQQQLGRAKSHSHQGRNPECRLDLHWRRGRLLLRV